MSVHYNPMPDTNATHASDISLKMVPADIWKYFYTVYDYAEKADLLKSTKKIRGSHTFDQ